MSKRDLLLYRHHIAGDTHDDRAPLVRYRLRQQCVRLDRMRFCYKNGKDERLTRTTLYTLHDEFFTQLLIFTGETLRVLKLRACKTPQKLSVGFVRVNVRLKNVVFYTSFLHFLTCIFSYIGLRSSMSPLVTALASDSLRSCKRTYKSLAFPTLSLTASKSTIVVGDSTELTASKYRSAELLTDEMFERTRFNWLSSANVCIPSRTEKSNKNARFETFRVRTFVVPDACFLNSST